jgi:hypothetical protein
LVPGHAHACIIRVYGRHISTEQHSTIHIFHTYMYGVSSSILYTVVCMIQGYKLHTQTNTYKILIEEYY